MKSNTLFASCFDKSPSLIVIVKTFNTCICKTVQLEDHDMTSVFYFYLEKIAGLLEIIGQQKMVSLHLSNHGPVWHDGSKY